MLCPLALLLLLTSPTLADTLDVGPGQTYPRIESALAAAKPGDTLLVHPGTYDRVAALIRVPRLTIRAVPGDAPTGFRGNGFEYSGIGSTPRAIVQFDPQAEGCTLDGFELSGARNATHNGAAVRINQADHVTVRNCTIHDCDMGIMSGGDGRGGGAADQRIEQCLIYANGAPAEPGFSHNLYLGGTSVVVSACEIHTSTAGHNLKSRAHYTRIEYCWIHDSANREIDLVDARGDTDTPGSDAVLLGNIIVKSRDCRGNRGVIHFGQDGGHDHTGTIHLVNNTIVTPYISPVLQLSAPGARARFVSNLIVGASAGRHVLFAALPGTNREELAIPEVSGVANFTFGSFDDGPSIGALSPTAGDATFKFADPVNGNYRLIKPTIADRGRPVPMLPPAPGRTENSVGVPLRQYLHPLQTELRSDSAAPAIGAFESSR